MTIVAQGLLVDLAPYLHVGYTSAYAPVYDPVLVPPNMPTGLYALGLVLLLAGALVPFLLRSRWGLTARLLTAGGLLLAALVVGLSGVRMHLKMRPYERGSPEEVTMQRGRFFLECVRNRGERLASVKPEERHMYLDDMLPRMRGEILKDYWHRDFILSVNKINGAEGRGAFEVTISSAGPDGQVGTADDIAIH